MIRQTLPATKEATFSINLPDASADGFPRPTGTGFFVSPDGWFVTAAHVVTEAGATRADVEQGALMQHAAPGLETVVLPSPRVDFVDQYLDIALLKLEFARMPDTDWLKARANFPHLTVSRRQLQEGEPVYAYGYPLSLSELQRSAEVLIGLTSLSPRATSAIVASTSEYHGPMSSTGQPVKYVIDKALNYGNSGGPILASETGHVHAVCTHFQPLEVPQPHLRDPQGNTPVILMPSLYGVVSSLSNPTVVSELENRGILVSDD